MNSATMAPSAWNALCQFLRTQAGIFLVNDRSKNHIPAQVLFPRLCHCDHAGSQAAFHIISSPSIQAAFLDHRFVRMRHSACSDRVHVTVEQQRFPAAGSSCNPNHIGPAWDGFN